jgi:hypothetical protein
VFVSSGLNIFRPFHKMAVHFTLNFFVSSNQNTQRARSAPAKVVILISTAGVLAVAVLGPTVPRASNLQCFARLRQFKTLCIYIYLCICIYVSL